MRKRIIFALWLGIVMSASISARQSSDTTAYLSGITQIKQAKTADDFARAERYFSDLSDKQPGDWLALYYAALADIQASYKADNKKRDGYLDKAQVFIDKAQKLKPGDAELMILQAFLYQSRIQVNPAMRGMSYSSKADALLKKALVADADNPRAYMLLGYNMYYTPSLFGGGADKALPLFMKAREKYAGFKPASAIDPQWGKDENDQMVLECKKSLNQANK